MVGKIRVLWLMEDFYGWEAKALWDDYKAWSKFKNDIERIAMVGDKRWEEWMSKLAKAVHLAEINYYDPASLEDAWEWLREGS